MAGEFFWQKEISLFRASSTHVASQTLFATKRRKKSLWRVIIEE
jgi:hypothetical protein